MTELAVLPLGEAAITIRLGEVASVELAERAAALAAAIRNEAIEGVTDVVPAVASVAIYYEIGAATGDDIAARVRAAIARPATERPAATFVTHTIPVRYDGEDLDDVAARVHLTREDVIARHTAREYRVLALGFLPGWAYLGPLDPSLSLPRRPTPRTRVPAGAVAIMGTQTGVYPRVTPGGWNLIGSTDAVLFDPLRSPPVLFRAGDRVRFSPVA